MEILPATMLGLYILLGVWLVPSVLLMFMPGPKGLKSRTRWVVASLVFNWFSIVFYSIKYMDVRTKEQLLMDQIQSL